MGCCGENIYNNDVKIIRFKNNFGEQDDSNKINRNGEEQKKDKKTKNEDVKNIINPQKNKNNYENKEEEIKQRNNDITVVKNLEKKKNRISFRCTYEIKDNTEIQIINYRGIVDVNEEIKSKIKILNVNNKEDLIFKKKI